MKLSFRARNLLILAGVLIAALSLDQVTKYLVRTHMALWEPVNVIPNILQLLYIQNRGAAFGLFQGSVTVLAIIAMIMVGAVVAFFFFSKKASTLEIVSLSLIVAGAVGNLIDRMMLGFVTDFIYFVPIDFPVFNVADIMVTSGTICFIVWALFFSTREDGAHKVVSAESPAARPRATTEDDRVQ